MPGALVLVIEADEWVSRLLEGAIREAGYAVMVCGFAQAGLEAAVAKTPDCIVCDVDLPDDTGYSVARQVRTHPSRVSVTPFLFLSGHDDEQSRIEGFHVGADVYITKPFRVDEVVAQIDALVQMAARLRARRDSMLSAPPGPAFGTAIEGDLEQMSIATVLTVLEMERRTGTFEVISKKRRAQLDILGGAVMEGIVGGTKVSSLAALRTMLGWTVGRFSFVPRHVGEAGRGSPNPSGQEDVKEPTGTEIPFATGTGYTKSLGALLIEALRLEDEATRAELELPPSRRRPETRSERVPGPAIGGPASSPADFAPPSTRVPRPSDLSLALDPELADWEIPSDAFPSGETLKPPPQGLSLGETPKPPRVLSLGETPKPPPRALSLGETPKPPRALSLGETAKPPLSVRAPPLPRIPPRPAPATPPAPPAPTPHADKKRG